MATIVKETGTGTASSNSYVTVAELETYATDRGITLSAADTAAKNALILKSMDYLEQMQFQGLKNTEAQALQWPRYGVVIDSYPVDTDTIPQLLQDAQMELAIGIDGGVNPLANVERETRRERVGDIEVEYSTSSSYQTYLKAAHYKLRKLLINGGMAGRAIRV